MRLSRLLAAALTLSIPFAAGQVAPDPAPASDVRLPSGKLQKEEILRADHEKSLQDAEKLMQLSEEIKIELERNDRHIVSVSSLKKLEEIEKLAKRIRGRLKRY